MNFTLNKKQQPMHLTKHGICTRERSQAAAEEYQVPIFENIAVRHAEGNSISSTLDVLK